MAPIDDLVKRKKLVVGSDDQQVLVVAHDGEFYAFENLCIHRARELSRGVILNGRLVCPGHQWAFALETGWESIKQECQPTYAVRVENDMVQVDLSSRRVLRQPSAACSD